MNILKITNEDGTDISVMPQNPLKEKWNKLYPPTPLPQYSQVCDGYSCTYCGRCPLGADWVVPEEDKKVWIEYQKQLSEYNKLHNLNLHN